MQTVLYFDCFSGISGDMTIGALLDLGIDQESFLADLNSLAVDGYHLQISQKTTRGIAATDFDVIIESDPEVHSHHHRNLQDILQIIENSSIDKAAKTLSRNIFETIAQAEAEVHNQNLDEVHFHEVGAIDSIVDIVGAALCISMLKPEVIMASPLHVGSGTVTCAHGVLPIPAPATLKILEKVPIYSTNVIGELVTPTGAAIIKNLASDFLSLPAMTVEKTGYGAGKKDFGHLNALRVMFGKIDASSALNQEQLIMLETNIDDMNPETYSYLLPLILEKGALDVFLADVIMKKGRPGTQISLLCHPQDVDTFENLLYDETTTLGIRKQMVERSSLERKMISVETPFGVVQVKAALRDGKPFRISPEYEICRKIASEKALPLREVYHIVRKASDDLIRQSVFKDRY
ncbi:MAG: nickel pincer cofactor biosynthesis protein LarC [Deltaproteobacteria bacterium]|nr:nickel pincer cofactor biosynthesis protein LarC [Deltaproteobacteria bacterium]